MTEQNSGTLRLYQQVWGNNNLGITSLPPHSEIHSVTSFLQNDRLEVAENTPGLFLTIRADKEEPQHHHIIIINDFQNIQVRFKVAGSQ